MDSLEKRMRMATERNGGNGHSMEEEHVRQGYLITQDKTDDFPKTVLQDGFEEIPEDIRVPQLHALVDACRTYYAGYFIKDNFGTDEKARLEWHTSMLSKPLQEVSDPEKALGLTQSYQEFQDKNKLRIAKIQSVYGLISSLVQTLDRYHVHSAQADTVRALSKRFPVITNIAQQDAFTGLPGDLGERLATALKDLPDHPGDAADRKRIEDTSWKILSFDKKVEIAQKIDSVAGDLLNLLTRGVLPSAPDMPKVPHTEE